jgi:hypothetical protein
MKKSLAALSCLALLAGGSRVDAAITISASEFSPLAPPGTTTAIVLAGIGTPSQAPVAGPGFMISFSGTGVTQGVVQGNLSGVHAVPVAGMTSGMAQYLTGDFGSPLTTSVAASGNYLSTGLGTITITFSTPESNFALLWGSMDTTNTVMFNNGAGDTVTGTAALAVASAVIPGFTGVGGSAWFLLSSDTPFTTVKLSSSVVSFESAAEVAGPLTFIPEPTSFVMAGTGAAFVGLMAFRKRRRRSPESV